MCCFSVLLSPSRCLRCALGCSLGPFSPLPVPPLWFAVLPVVADAAGPCSLCKAGGEVMKVRNRARSPECVFVAGVERNSDSPSARQQSCEHMC